jgi:tRNA (guanine-N7-)-methyltransferase
LETSTSSPTDQPAAAATHANAAQATASSVPNSKTLEPLGRASNSAAGFGLIHPLASILDRLDPLRLFRQPQPLEVELGSGDGSFLLQQASRHPDRNFIGVERLLGRLRKLDRKGGRAGLTNLRLVRIEAGYFLEYLLPPAAAQALHIYFPDPWPKKRHRNHRLVNERFTDIARQALVPGGIAYLRTDDADYFTQMRAVFGANAAFQETETPAALSELATDFERHFQAQGVATLRAAYQRTS